jgi:hypothetical protein
MRTLVGGDAGDGATGAGEGDLPGSAARGAAEPGAGGDADDAPPPPSPTLDELLPDPSPPPVPQDTGSAGSASATGARSRHLPSLAPDPEPGHARSRFDADAGVVLYSDRHADYLLVKDDEAGLLDYLATLVAKEYVVYNNPRATSDDLAEEMVRMLVRVRRHLPKRR